jgi:hypothetical protein
MLDDMELEPVVLGTVNGIYGQQRADGLEVLTGGIYEVEDDGDGTWNTLGPLEDL